MSVEEAFETSNRPVVSIMTVADTVYESLPNSTSQMQEVTTVDSTEEASRSWFREREEAFLNNSGLILSRQKHLFSSILSLSVA